MDVKAEDKQDSNETLLSPYTNKPYRDGSAFSGATFWCEICLVKLTNGRSAINHLTGARHLSILRGDKKADKRKLMGCEVIEDPAAKRERTYPDYCTVCQLELSSQIVAGDHFKGKRHLANVDKRTHFMNTQRGVNHSRGRGNSFARGVNSRYTRPQSRGNSFAGGVGNRFVRPQSRAAFAGGGDNRSVRPRGRANACYAGGVDNRFPRPQSRAAFAGGGDNQSVRPRGRANTFAGGVDNRFQRPQSRANAFDDSGVDNQFVRPQSNYVWPPNRPVMYPLTHIEQQRTKNYHSSTGFPTAVRGRFPEPDIHNDMTTRAFAAFYKS